MRLCFATNNRRKLSEISQLIGKRFELLSLEDVGHGEDIPEDHETMEENSMQKACFIKERYGIDCFTDDSGLEVKALNGAPGVYSARYAGPQRNSLDNNTKLLREMESEPHRSARFKSVISLIIGKEEHQFEGIVEGQLVKEPRGTNGFGYDPLFIPNGYDQTFAEMSAEEKNRISHRGLAVKKLVNYLQVINSEV